MSSPVPEMGPLTTSSGSRTVLARNLVLRGIGNRLDAEFGELFTRDTLDHYVADSYDDLASRSKVLTHLPAFVDRFARQRLRALAKNRGLVFDHTPEVLFVCQRNDAASQIAAALFNAKADGRGHAQSAGATPADELLADAVHVLHEVGLDLLGEFPKPLTPEIEQSADVIVTLDAHDDISIIDAKQYYAWDLPPGHHDAGIEGYRMLRDGLDGRIDQLVAAVVPPVPEGRLAMADRRTALVKQLVDVKDHVVRLLERLDAGLAAGDPGALAAIEPGDDVVDRAERSLRTSSLELIAQHQPVARDLRFVLAVLDAGLHLERIADGAVNVAGLARVNDGALIGALPPEVRQMLNLVAVMTDEAVRSLAEQDQDLGLSLESADAALDQLAVRIFERLLTEHEDGRDRLTELTIDRVSRLLKRSGEHALDIAEGGLFAAVGSYRELGRDQLPGDVH